MILRCEQNSLVKIKHGFILLDDVSAGENNGSPLHHRVTQKQTRRTTMDAYTHS